MADTFSKSERSRIMALVKSKDTRPEMTVRRLVHAMGFRYRLHVESLPGKPDLVFPRLKKIINVHGCFWHMHSCKRCRIPSSRREYWVAKLKRNAARDRRTRSALVRCGWEVLVIWECRISRANLLRTQNRIRTFLERYDVVKTPKRA
jgi:DNA mismatch endonuclease, patch repair protein